MKDDKIVNNFTINEKMQVICGDMVIGYLFDNSGILILDFGRNPGDIQVYCSYTWENA